MHYKVDNLIYAIIIAILLLSISSRAIGNADTLNNSLKKEIKIAADYDRIKLNEIKQLQYALQTAEDITNRYNIYLKLYEEYKYYNYDSALLYAGKLKLIGQENNNPSLIADARLKTIFVMLSGGMFKETFDSLNVLSVDGPKDSLKAQYFVLKGLLYFNLADFNGDSHSTALYNNKANLYLDSALGFYTPGSFDYLYNAALKFLKKGKTDSALHNLFLLTGRKALSYHQIALTTSTIGGILISSGHEEQAKPFLIQASIADIKSSTKETLALLTLAGIVYKEGNIEDAVLYIEKANADAVFYNARLRKVQIGSLLPLIEGAMIRTIKSQKDKLQFFLLIMSVLVLLLAAFAVIIRTQVKKLTLARQRLLNANLEQRQINQALVVANELKEKYNSQLEDINRQLSEANKIKEEYIGYYFNLDTTFLARIERMLIAIERKLIDRKWDEIKFVLKTIDLKTEKEELLKNFDKVFLRLFPNFVSQFNSLLKETGKIALPEDQLLNTELRIYALIRLGITESEKIAEILGYSVNTIYAKKTKIRREASIDKEDFEKTIVHITTLTR